MDNKEKCPVSGQPCGHVIEGHCDEHLVAMERRSMDRRDIDNTILEIKNIKDDQSALCRQLALMNNDLSYVKRPLSVIAGAIILYLVGQILKVIPFLTTLIEVKKDVS